MIVSLDLQSWDEWKEAVAIVYRGILADYLIV